MDKVENIDGTSNRQCVPYDILVMNIWTVYGAFSNFCAVGLTKEHLKIFLVYLSTEGTHPLATLLCCASSNI